MGPINTIHAPVRQKTLIRVKPDTSYEEGGGKTVSLSPPNIRHPQATLALQAHRSFIGLWKVFHLTLMRARTSLASLRQKKMAGTRLECSP